MNVNNNKDKSLGDLSWDSPLEQNLKSDAKTSKIAQASIDILESPKAFSSHAADAIWNTIVHHKKDVTCNDIEKAIQEIQLDKNYDEKARKSDFEVLQNRCEIVKKFKVGDIIATKMVQRKSKDVETVDKLITFTQKMINKLKGQKAVAGKDIVHFSIVTKIDEKTGTVFITEAMPGKHGGGIREVSFFDERGQELRAGSGYIYEVFRKDEELRDIPEQAESYASRMSPGLSSYSKKFDTSQDTVGSVDEISKTKQKKSTKFSFAIGLRAMFAKRTKIHMEKCAKRFFKALADNILADQGKIHSTRGKKKSRKKFFCSYFVGSVVQMEMAGKNVVDQFKGDEDLQKIKQEKSAKKTAKKISEWAQKQAKNFMKNDQLTQWECVKKALQFDPKNTSPQQLLQELQKLSYNPVLRIVPQTK